MSINQPSCQSSIHQSIGHLVWSSINQPTNPYASNLCRKEKVGQGEKTRALAGYVNFTEVIFSLGAVVSWCKFYYRSHFNHKEKISSLFANTSVLLTGDLYSLKGDGCLSSFIAKGNIRKRDYFLLVPSDICLEKTYILSELDLRWFILSRDKSNPTKHKPFVALWRTVQCVSCFPPVFSWKAKVSHETRGKKVEIGSNFQIAQLHLNRK